MSLYVFQSAGKKQQSASGLWDQRLAALHTDAQMSLTARRGVSLEECNKEFY